MTDRSKETPRTVLAVSDLHLFTPRSDGESLFRSLGSRLSRAEVLVLNGDTFDFRWSTYPNHEASVQAACRWLEDLLKCRPNLVVHFLLGNHDCLDVFARCLPRLSQTCNRFHWHTYWLVLGAALFLHGDCVQGRMDARELGAYRSRWRHDGRRSGSSLQAYVGMDRLGLTRLAHRWSFPRRRTLARIGYYLDHVCPEWRRFTRDCYFGHTHVPFSDEEFEGTRFHNTGSAIRGMGFNPCDACC